MPSAGCGATTVATAPINLNIFASPLADIFTTPIGSRIQRREYGSHLFDLIDAPMNPANRLRLAAALVDAASRWEPRVVLETAVIDITMDGKTEISYTARTLDDAELRGQATLRH